MCYSEVANLNSSGCGPPLRAFFYVLVNMYLVKVISADLAFNKGLAGANILFNGVYAVSEVIAQAVYSVADSVQSVVNVI